MQAAPNLSAVVEEKLSISSELGALNDSRLLQAYRENNLLSYNGGIMEKLQQEHKWVMIGS